MKIIGAGGVLQDPLYVSDCLCPAFRAEARGAVEHDHCLDLVVGASDGRLGYGHHAERLDKPTLDAFLADVPRCAEALAGYSQDGNRLMFEALDEQIRRATAGERLGAPHA